MTSKPALLRDLSTPPKTGTSWLYRWADYAELRCLTHRDGRFSRDNFAEALQEAEDLNHDGESAETQDDDAQDVAGMWPTPADNASAERDDRHEALAARCFNQLALRSQIFSADWPFTLSADTLELSLRYGKRTPGQWLYLQLLLSASLQYCNPRRRRELTDPFEGVSLEIFRRLMPTGAEVHAFGASHSTRYTGHLYDRLVALMKDLRGCLHLQREHFSTHDTGDGGLDMVAWHPMGDTRDRLPVALAQCGCTSDGWPSKSAEASPDRLSGNLHLPSSWATYYFMPLDLTMALNTGVDWQRKSDMSTAIVVDRLRMIRLADPVALQAEGQLQTELINEAAAMQLT